MLALKEGWELHGVCMGVDGTLGTGNVERLLVIESRCGNVLCTFLYVVFFNKMFT